MIDTITPLACPHCGDDTVVRLPDDWQKRVDAGAAIPIVGCGNPWHYANLDIAAERARIRAAVERENFGAMWVSRAAVLAIVDRPDDG